MLTFQQMLDSMRMRPDGRREMLDQYVPYNEDGSANWRIIPSEEDLPLGVELPCKVSLPRSRYNRETTVESRAIAVYLENRSLNLKQIAETVGCHRGSLSPARCPRLHAIIDADRHPVPIGQKLKDGSVEAWVTD